MVTVVEIERELDDGCGHKLPLKIEGYIEGGRVFDRVFTINGDDITPAITAHNYESDWDESLLEEYRAIQIDHAYERYMDRL